MSRTFRRVKYFYNFYGSHKLHRRGIFKTLLNTNIDVVSKDMVKYFSDSDKFNNQMLNAVARQMMRREARVKITHEFRKYSKKENWDNYCTITHNRYSNPWSYD